MVEDKWRVKLTPEEYKVMREKSTELPFTGKFNKHSDEGIYVCKGCGQELFDSKTKFDSKTGWPSFSDCKKETIKYVVDKGLFTSRTEVVCSKCGGHLGHVFDDGPEPTGRRYCINSVSLDFKSSR